MSDLLETLQAIREESYPNIKPELVEKIFKIELENVERRSAAFREIETIVEIFLSREV